MAETTHARSRRAALLGLALQVVATLAVAVLAIFMRSHSMAQLGWFLAGGIPLWLVSVLVFRQHELAALEAMDLEELRRERGASAGSEAMFTGEGGELGFNVARARLEWMRRWLVPIFGLISAVYLVAGGVFNFLEIRGIYLQDQWEPLPRDRVQLGFIILTVIILLLFFCARYAAGMARVPQWQLLRGCGSFMLGNAIAALAVVVGLAIFLLQYPPTWEHWVAFVIPGVMVLLGAETLLNFVLDIYRPRTPGVEPRACFDSRLLGLISEPGGIARSLAEAINYQFGFQVSQTWFYQLLQRTMVPLVLVGALAVWLLTSIVVVQPYERAIIEEFGAQIDATDPLEPGVYFKWPAPFAVARKYNTDQLHEFVVGFQIGDQPEHEAREGVAPEVELWTDSEHAGHEHFDFVISTPPPEQEEPAEPGETESETGEPPAGEAAAVELAADATGTVSRAPVNQVRMNVVVQYRIRPKELHLFTQHTEEPHELIRRLAWNEVTQFNAASYMDELMGAKRQQMADTLRRNLARRADRMRLGLEIVYVGVVNVHPERSVAEAFRKTVNAQQEKIAEIRKARVEESRILSQVAGDRDQATALVYALDRVEQQERARNEALNTLEGTNAASEDTLEPLRPLEDEFRAVVEARWSLDRAQRQRDLVVQEYELGLGRSLRETQQAAERVAEAEARLDAAQQTLTEALEPVQRELRAQYDSATAAALVERARAQVGLAFWTGQVERQLVGLEGDAAVTLAQAQARRWQRELTVAGQVTRLGKEREAFQAAPEIYKVRSYLEVLVEALKGSRKYFLAFEPGERLVKIRIEAQERARPDRASAAIETK